MQAVWIPYYYSFRRRIIWGGGIPKFRRGPAPTRLIRPPSRGMGCETAFWSHEKRRRLFCISENTKVNTLYAYWLGVSDVCRWPRYDIKIGQPLIKWEPSNFEDYLRRAGHIPSGIGRGRQEDRSAGKSGGIRAENMHIDVRVIHSRAVAISRATTYNLRRRAPGVLRLWVGFHRDIA